MHCYYVFALRLLIVVLLLNSVSYVTGTLAFDTVVRMYVSSHVFLFCCCMLFLLFIVRFYHTMVNIDQYFYFYFIYCEIRTQGTIYKKTV